MITLVATAALARPARPLRRGLLALSLTALAAACGPDAPPRDPSGDVVNYRCEDGTEFSTTFKASSPVIELAIGGATFTLTQVPSDLGIAYSDGRMTLSILREHATLVGGPAGELDLCKDVDEEELFD